MRIYLYILFILACLVQFSSCKKAMTPTSIEQNLSEFDTVQFNSVFDVSLIQDTFNAIRIEGAANILKKISISVENNTLILENNYHGNWMHPKNNKIKIYLTVNKLNFIKVNETCNITTFNTLITDDLLLVLASKLNHATLDINCNTFSYWNNFPCGGKVVLTGNTNKLAIWNGALMAVDAYGLNANDVYCENQSKGSCKIKSLQQLKYKIKGEGNIYLKGNPLIVIDEEDNATGELIVE